ncbi:MAG: hypothetical protein HWN79_18895, partial [Candidatus Lokiarchaeota archaeon]|nr:hypothetical protein [Candidatus Lokiarchaeota archaeon]
MNENKKMPFQPELIFQAIIKYISALLFVGLLLFVPAGSFKFWNAWVFMGALFIPMIFVMVYLIIKDPELMQKRMNVQEKEKTQKIYVVLSIIVFIITYAIP